MKEQILKKLKESFSQPEEKFLNEYYLKDIESNLFFRPYDKIDSRAYSIRSSAAMIYNTIGPDAITFDGVRYSKIEYERKFPVLQKRPPAQLDVSLQNDEISELLLVEAKCLEWIDNPKSLKDAYLMESNYRINDESIISIFIESFRNLLSYPEKRDLEDKTRILPYYQIYDAIQMNIHILGIYTYCVKEKKNLPKRIRLLNIVWDYDEAEEYQTEEREGKEYVSFANVNFRNLFKQLGIDFSVEYVRYSDFLKRVDWSNDMEHRKYLERYEIK